MQGIDFFFFFPKLILEIVIDFFVFRFGNFLFRGRVGRWDEMRWEEWGLGENWSHLSRVIWYFSAEPTDTIQTRIQLFVYGPPEVHNCLVRLCLCPKRNFYIKVAFLLHQMHIFFQLLDKRVFQPLKAETNGHFILFVTTTLIVGIHFLSASAIIYIDIDIDILIFGFVLVSLLMFWDIT